MDPPPGRRRAAARAKTVRPGFLAAGLGLMWFVQMQLGGVDADAPGWAVALIFAGRLLADVVGAWVTVSLVRLAVLLSRLALVQRRAQSRPDVR